MSSGSCKACFPSYIEINATVQDGRCNYAVTRVDIDSEQSRYDFCVLRMSLNNPLYIVLREVGTDSAEEKVTGRDVEGSSLSLDARTYTRIGPRQLRPPREIQYTTQIQTSINHGWSETRSRKKQPSPTGTRGGTEGEGGDAGTI